MQTAQIADQLTEPATPPPVNAPAFEFVRQLAADLSGPAIELPSYPKVALRVLNSFGLVIVRPSMPTTLPADTTLGDLARTFSSMFPSTAQRGGGDGLEEAVRALRAAEASVAAAERALRAAASCRWRARKQMRPTRAALA